jgi:PPOX class probable F420-dependent enzyme
MDDWAQERLRDHVTIWLTTVSSEGQPQSTPVWFLWDGFTFLVYSRPDTPKLANIASNPKVSVHLDGDAAGNDVATFEGTAEVLRDRPPADQVPAYVEKYSGPIRDLGLTPESFAVDYSVPIRITPTRDRIWE